MPIITHSSAAESSPTPLSSHSERRLRQQAGLAIGSALVSAPWLCAGLLLCSPAAHAKIVLEIRQKGADVIIKGSGSANLSALTPAGSSSTYTNLLTDHEVYAGPAAWNDGSVSFFIGLSGPSSISGNTVLELPDLAGSSGDLFGILSKDNNGNQVLVLPQGYISGDTLSGLSLYPQTDFATIGLSPGIFTWTWGAGPTADSLQVRIGSNPANVPAPLPLAGAAMAYSWATRLRRRTRRAACPSTATTRAADQPLA